MKSLDEKLKMDKELLNLDKLLECVNKEIAISQREQELARGMGLEGTAGYEQMGCYTCDGYNFKCPAYMSKKDVYEGESD